MIGMGAAVEAGSGGQVDRGADRGNRAVREGYTRRGILSAGDERRIIEWCEAKASQALLRGGWEAVRNRAMVRLMLATGLRRAEVAGLDLEDLHLGGGDPREWYVVVRHGKGDKRRDVPLGPAIRRVLREYVAWRKGRECSEGGVLSGALFVSERGGRMTGNGVWRVWRGVLSDVGVRGEGLGCHAARRRLASRLAEGGASVWVIRDILGHSDIRTTSVYVRDTLVGQVAAVAAM